MDRLRLKSLRQASGISRAEAAKSLGITLSYYGMIEHGTRQPALGLARRIAALVGSSVEDLFGDEPAAQAAA